MKFSIKDFFSKCDQILSFLQICSHLLKKSLKGNSFVHCVISPSGINWSDEIAHRCVLHIVIINLNKAVVS